MFKQFERPLKIICLALAALLAWDLGGVILRNDPLVHLKIPALPSLPEAKKETPKPAPNDTKNAAIEKSGTNALKAAIHTNSTNATNTGAKGPASKNELANTNANSRPKPGNSRTPNLPSGMPPGMAAQMMGGGMPGGPGMQKLDLPPEVQGRVDRIIDSEIFGPIMRPMPMALIGIAGDEAFIRATNGQTGPVKIGGELADIKLLRIGVNRVLVEQDGEKKELTLFGGVGGESLMPAPAKPSSTNTPSTNAPATNAPAKHVATRNAASKNASAN